VLLFWWWWILETIQTPSCLLYNQTIELLQQTHILILIAVVSVGSPFADETDPTV
jgi:hypothetical protein